MKLYLCPGAFSLATHIALIEAGLEFETEFVDLANRRTATGKDFTEVNPKGYVPALVLDDGEVLTETPAILRWIADRAPALHPGGELGPTRLTEMAAFIASEIHRPFMRSFFSPADEEKTAARAAIEARFAHLEERLPGDYLFGDTFTAADGELFVMLDWALRLGLAVGPGLTALHDRVEARPSVIAASRAEAAPAA